MLFHLLIFLCMSIQFPQHVFLKRWSSLFCIFLASLLIISRPYILGFNSRLSILFHWSVGLFICSYHTIVNTVASWNSLNLGNMIFPALFFLRLLWLLWVFCGSLWILGCFFYFCKKKSWFWWGLHWISDNFG